MKFGTPIQGILIATMTVVLSSGAFAANPETESHGPSQSAADVIREFAGADVAFLAAGMVKAIDAPTDLAQLLVYPTDTVSVVRLTGAELKAAFERSVSLLPLPSSAFLQVSGAEITFSKSSPADRRVQSVSIGNAKLDGAKSYTVAMPTTLARGGLGYFKVWSRDAITKTVEGATLESILKGRAPKSTADRWISQ